MDKVKRAPPPQKNPSYATDKDKVKVPKIIL